MKSSISVLTTLYNHEDYIEATLSSAIRQTLMPNEIIVMDDGSTDRSLLVAQSLKHPAITVIPSDRNLGGPNTIRGLSKCSGDLVAILNSDDIWEPQKLEYQATHILNHPNCGVVFSRVKLIDEVGNGWPENSHILQSIFSAPNRTRHEWLKHLFYFCNAFCASSALIRRDLFDKIGTFDARYSQLQDFDFWLRTLISGYDVYVVDEPLTRYRAMKSGANLSAAMASTKSVFTFEYVRILKNYWRISTISDLKKIFPEINISPEADDRLCLYYLAKHAASLKTIHHKILAVETMMEWGGNYEAMKMASYCHGFDAKAYREFIANGPYSKLLGNSIFSYMEKVTKSILPYHLKQKILSYRSRN